MSQSEKKQQNLVHLQQQVNLHQVLLNDVDQFQQLCKTQPDLVPQFVEYADSQLSYIVGYWWLSLEEGQKKEQLEKHSVFAEKFTYQTCMMYGTVCKKIPTFNRIKVVEQLNIKICLIITNAASDEKELETLFNVALATGISARNMETFVKEYKESKSIGQAIIKALPESGAIQGDRGDKKRFEQLIFDVKREAEKEAKQELELAKSQARKILEDANQKAQANSTKSQEILNQAQQEAQKFIEDAKKKVSQISANRQNQKQQATKTYETEYNQLQKELEELQNRFAELATQRLPVQVKEKVVEVEVEVVPDDYEELIKFRDEMLADLEQQETAKNMLEACKRFNQEDNKMKAETFRFESDFHNVATIVTQSSEIKLSKSTNNFKALS